MINIGNVPLEQIPLSTEGADFVDKIAASTKIRKIDARYKELENEFANENFTYHKIPPSRRLGKYDADLERTAIEKRAEIGSSEIKS